MNFKCTVLQLAAAITGIFGTAAFAADKPQPGDAIYTQGRQSTANGPVARQLLATAQKRGKIRINVGLKMTLQDEDAISQFDADRQRQRLQWIQDGVVARAGASDVHRFDTIPFITMTVDQIGLQTLFNDPDVISVQEDKIARPLLDKTVKIVQAKKMWTKSTGKKWRVAVLDTGANYDHVMLKGKVVAGGCYSTNAPSANATSLCPGGVSSSTAKASGRNCPASLSGCDHGTHVSSIAVGKHPQLNGVAKGSQLISMQVFSRIADTTFCNGAAACVGSFSSDQVKALEAIFKKRKTQKVAAVNMSLGGGSFSSACDTNDPMLTSIISKLRKAGIAVAIASGNNGFDGSIGSPACISHAITVGNSTDADNVSPSSNHSKDVDVMAPGTNILAAVLGGNGAIDNKTGTSMAAPHVAGAFALLRAAMGSKLKAKEAVDKIELALECTGAPVSRNDLEKPRINIFSAFKYLKRPPKGEVWNFKKDDDGWESIIGKFVAKNGNYIVKKFASAGWAVSRAPYCDDDVVVKSRMLRKDPAVNIHYNTGLLIGTFNKKGRSATGYWYAFNKLGGGQVVIWRIDGYNFETRSGPASLLCTSSVPIKIGGYNKITAYLKGGKQVLQLNGKTACTATDTTYDKIREVGMAAAVDQASPGGHSVKIDAVAVVPVGQRTPAIEQVSSIVSTQSKAFTHSPLGAVRNNKVMSSTAH